MSYRTEHDLIGERRIPQDAYYGIHTYRAVENFPVSGRRVHPELIKSLALVKQAAAEANLACGFLQPSIGRAIIQAASEIAEGKLWDQFPVDALQGGAGTSTNMNMNEVIANRAIEILGGTKGDYEMVHPINHVNLSQSTNDVYPTAVRVACIRLLLPLADALADLQAAFQAKEAEFAGVLKVGRTEMQDAVPVTLGQEFGAFAEAIARDRWRLYKVEERLREINLGGTAVGTGLNADRRYIFLVVEKLRTLTGLGLARAENTIDPTQNADIFAEVSGLVKASAVNLAKIATDIILLASGPRAGLAEIHLPEVQAGSSIMPGKVNPVIPEMVVQVAYQVMANDLAITLATQAGKLELNAFLPLVADRLLDSLEIMRRAVERFRLGCVVGIQANRERCRQLLDQSFELITALVPVLGYEQATEIVLEVERTGRSVTETLLARGLFTKEELEAILAPERLTRPGMVRLRPNSTREV